MDTYMIKKGVQNYRDEGCVQGGGSSEKEKEVKEDKNLALGWPSD